MRPQTIDRDDRVQREAVALAVVGFLIGAAMATAVFGGLLSRSVETSKQLLTVATCWEAMYRSAAGEDVDVVKRCREAMR